MTAACLRSATVLVKYGGLTATGIGTQRGEDDANARSTHELVGRCRGPHEYSQAAIR